MTSKALVSMLANLTKGRHQQTMILARLSQSQLSAARPFCCSAVCRKEEPQKVEDSGKDELQNVEKPSISNAKPSVQTLGDIGKNHVPTRNDKYVMVFVGMYNKLEDIPHEVRHSQIFKSYDLFRVRMWILFTVLLMFSAAFFMHSGRKAARLGNTLGKEHQIETIEARKQALKEEWEAFRLEKAAKEASKQGAVA